MSRIVGRRNFVPNRGTMILVVGFLATAVLSNQAEAARIVLDFEGEINSVRGTAVGGPFQVGDPVTGRLVFDPDEAVDRIPDAPEFGRYNADSIESFELTAGTYPVEGDPLAPQSLLDVVSREDNLYQLLFRTGALGAEVNGVAPYSIQFALSSFDLDPRPGKEMPDAETLEALMATLPTLPSPAGINHLIFGGPGLDRVDWVVTSYVVTPEPTSGLLVLLGLALFPRRPRARSGS